MGLELGYIQGLVRQTGGLLDPDGEIPVPEEACELVDFLDGVVNDIAGLGGPEASAARSASRLAFLRVKRLHCVVTTDDVGSDQGVLTIEPGGAAGVELSNAISAVDGLLPGLLTGILGVDVRLPNSPLTENFRLNNGEDHHVEKLPVPFIGSIGVTIVEEDDWNDDDVLTADIIASDNRSIVNLAGSTGKYELHYEIVPLLGRGSLVGQLIGCPSGGLGQATSGLLVAASRSIAWNKVGFPDDARRIALGRDGTLYALNENGSLWSNSSGGADEAWKNTGSLPEKTSAISASDTRLFYLDGDRNLLSLDPKAPTVAKARLGNPFGAADVAVMAGPGDKITLWALNDDRTLWRNERGGADDGWEKVGRPFEAARIAASEGFVYALNDDKTLWRSPAGLDGTWVKIDHPHSAMEMTAATIAGVDTLFVLNTDFTLWTTEV